MADLDKVIIAGAGPAGCALAHGLKKANIPFSIFEKAASASSTRNWAFTLGWARPYLLSLLPPPLGSKLSTCQVDPSIDCAATGSDRIVLYNGATREAAFTFPIPGAREINIRLLRELLSADLDVQYAKKFSHYTILVGEQGSRGIQVHFEDGGHEDGMVLVGMDGASSAVRRQLLGEQDARNEVLPFALVNFTAKYTAGQAVYLKQHLHPLVDIAIHPRGLYIRSNVLDMPDPEDPSSWTFQILSTWPLKSVEDYDNDDGSVGRLARLKAQVKRQGWAEPYCKLVEWIPEGTEIGRDQLKVWKTKAWGNEGGRVTLGGDAAHGMTFHRGQGANNSIYDSYCFVEAIKSVHAGKQTLHEAITRYDEEVVKRGQLEVQISKAQTFFTHDWENFIKSPVITLGTKPSHAARTEGYDEEDDKRAPKTGDGEEEDAICRGDCIDSDSE